MMATKFRALYQRKKGRDLFDLWLVLTVEDVDDSEIVLGLRHYMKDSTFTYPQLRLNLLSKLADEVFRTDMADLVTSQPEWYLADAAADVVMERLGGLLDNAPARDSIDGGAWRSRAATRS